MLPDLETRTSMLISASRAARIDLGVDFVAPISSSVPVSTIVKAKVYEWLNSVGLKVNPFAILDASQDPFIPFYLIDHNQYTSINGDFTSFVFASPGSGKSAFRVRLTRDCRVGKGGRKIFPIVYNLPSTDDGLISTDIHYRMLAKSAAKELMLHLVYQSPSILNNDDLLFHFERVFDLGLDLDYARQMAEKGSTQPLLDSFDQTARLLPNPPSRRDLVHLATKLNGIRYSASTLPKMNYEQKLEYIISLLFEKLGYEAIYVLVDGVDGYVETGGNTENAVNAISWLLEKTSDWQRNRIFMKYFLPDDMKDVLERRFPLLTSQSKVTMIKWNADTLSEVIRQRLQEASGGKYNSLRGISSLPLRGAKLAPEEVLAREIAKLDNPTPRDLIQAVNWLIVHHAQYDEQEKLTPKDMQAALGWIHSHKAVFQFA